MKAKLMYRSGNHDEHTCHHGIVLSRRKRGPFNLPTYVLRQSDYDAAVEQMAKAIHKREMKSIGVSQQWQDTGQLFFKSLAIAALASIGMRPERKGRK